MPAPWYDLRAARDAVRRITKTSASLHDEHGTDIGFVRRAPSRVAADRRPAPGGPAASVRNRGGDDPRIHLIARTNNVKDIGDATSYY